MEYLHVVGVRPGGDTKFAYNIAEDEMLEKFVIPFVQNGTMRFKYGGIREVQIVDMRIYKTDSPWDKKRHGKLEDFIKGKRNQFHVFSKRAEKALSQPRHRAFVVMPIQGKKTGSQEEKRIYREFNSRFEAIEKLLAEEYETTAIRIDKEYPLDEMVSEIKREIDRSVFIIADLTDERPSCYFEAGYATARGRDVLYIASEHSIITPGSKTKIHFDIHNHVTFFSDSTELVSELKEKIDKNRDRLFPQDKHVTV